MKTQIALMAPPPVQLASLHVQLLERAHPATAEIINGIRLMRSVIIVVLAVILHVARSRGAIVADLMVAAGLMLVFIIVVIMWLITDLANSATRVRETASNACRQNTASPATGATQLVKPKLLPEIIAAMALSMPALRPATTAIL